MTPDARCLTADACHEETDLLRIGSACGQNAHHASIEEDREPVREGEQLVQILGDEEGSRAASSLFAQCLVDRFGGADVDAAGGMNRDDQTRLTGKLAGEQEFL